MEPAMILYDLDFAVHISTLCASGKKYSGHDSFHIIVNCF